MVEEAGRAKPVDNFPWLEEIFIPYASSLNDGSDVFGVEEVKATLAPMEGIRDGALGEVAN